MNPRRLEKMIEDFRVEMRNEIINVLIGLRRNIEIKEEYEEVVKDIEVLYVEIHVDEAILLRVMTK